MVFFSYSISNAYLRTSGSNNAIDFLGLKPNDETWKRLEKFYINNDMKTVEFNGSLFNSGIYYYSLVIDGQKMNTKFMILVK